VEWKELQQEFVFAGQQPEGGRTLADDYGIRGEYMIYMTIESRTK